MSYFISVLMLVANIPQPPPADRNLQPKEVGNITGYYACQGKAGNESYSGITIIAPAHGVFIVQWALGDNRLNGVGFRAGNDLVVGWANDGTPSLRGVTWYKIEAGPRLVGSWASLPGDGQVHTEILTFLRPLNN